MTLGAADACWRHFCLSEATTNSDFLFLRAVNKCYYLLIATIIWVSSDVRIVSRRYYANSTGYQSESVSSSKWLVSFVSRCPGRRLSTWQMTAVSCPTALGALCGQLTFRLAWCREHLAVTATEHLQPLDLTCRTLFRSSCAIQTSPTDCSDDSWTDTFSRSMNTALCDFWYATS